MTETVESAPPSWQVPPTLVSKRASERLTAEDDPVHLENAVVRFLELKKAGVLATLHMYKPGAMATA